MTGNKEWFLDLKVEYCRTMKLRNDMQMTVATKGRIKMQMNGITQ